MLTKSLANLIIPTLTKQLIILLITRTIRKIRYLLYTNPSLISKSEPYFTNLGIDKPFILSLINEMTTLNTALTKEVMTLYPSYFQELIELISTLFCPFSPNKEDIQNPIKLMQPENPSIPEWLLSSINLATILNYIRREGLLFDELEKNALNNIRIDSQWDRILFIEGLPQEWEEQKVKENLVKIIEKNKGRIVNPAIDVIVLPIPGDIIQTNKKDLQSGNCIVFLDGWDILDLDEVTLHLSKSGPEDQNVMEEVDDEGAGGGEGEGEPEWECPTCTYRNPWSNLFCELTGDPRPVVMQKAQDIIEVQHTNLSELEKENQRKDQER